MSAKSFKVNVQNRKHKFFRSLNGIISKVGNLSSPVVIISLVESYCLPILLYGLEGLSLNKSLTEQLDAAYSQLYTKLFKTFDKTSIYLCQYYLNKIPLKYIINNRKINFLISVSKFSNFLRYIDLNCTELVETVGNFLPDSKHLSLEEIVDCSNNYWKCEIFDKFEYDRPIGL